MHPASPALRQLFQLSPLLLLLGFAQHLLGQLTNYALSPATDGTECLNIIRPCSERLRLNLMVVSLMLRMAIKSWQLLMTRNLAEG